MRRILLIGLLLSVGAPATRAQKPEEKRATILYLSKLAQPKGGFTPVVAGLNGPKPTPSLRATTTALRALRYFDGIDNQLEANRRFVDSCFHPDSGGFSETPGLNTQPDVVATAIGLMAVVDLKMPLDKYRDSAVRYLAQNAKGFEQIRIAAAGFEAAGVLPPQAKDFAASIELMRNPQGDFGKADGAARESGGAIVAQLRCGAKPEHIDVILTTMRNGQRFDGGFGKAGTDKSDLETSYRVMRAFMMLKSKPADPNGVRRFVAKCRNADGGYSDVPGQPSTVGGTYFAGIILNWVREMN